VRYPAVAPDTALGKNDDMPRRDVTWTPDFLGSDFEQATLDLGRDDEGDVVATLVRYTPPPARSPRRLLGRKRLSTEGADVLYVHGWSDYFFQDHVAEFWQSQGARFFALDLRKYGRSLRTGQTPGFVSSLDTYDADIEAALELMGHGAGTTPKRPLILLGHSTGGLVLSLWLSRHQGRAQALILNSPWLEYQLTAAGRQVAATALKISSRVDPRAAVPNPDLGFYNRALSKSQGGLWEFREEWKPARSFTPRAAWLQAVLAGHAAVSGGLNIEAPVLTLLSARTVFLPRWTEDMREADTVIDVTTAASRAVKLGRVVTVTHVPGAVHDVFLSAPAVRARAFADIQTWLGAYL
jgi:alpha-beta hydrolase superfamily lysophospholipase